MNLATLPALVLNADYRPVSYFPLSLMAWSDAVTAVVADRVAVVAEYDVVVRSPSTTITLPSVVALRRFRRGTRRVAFTRYNVFLRDRFACQYCGEVRDAANLTFDHVRPRSKGGATCWSNVVTACRPCNSAKGDRLDILPLRPVGEPTVRDLLAARKTRPVNHLHASWTDYLYWDSELGD